MRRDGWLDQPVVAMTEIPDTWSARAVARAIEANTIGQYPLLFACSPRVEVHDDTDMMWISSAIPHPYLNFVLRAHLGPEG